MSPHLRDVRAGVQALHSCTEWQPASNCTGMLREKRAYLLVLQSKTNVPALRLSLVGAGHACCQARTPVLCLHLPSDHDLAPADEPNKCLKAQVAQRNGFRCVATGTVFWEALLRIRFLLSAPRKVRHFLAIGCNPHHRVHTTESLTSATRPFAMYHAACSYSRLARLDAVDCRRGWLPYMHAKHCDTLASLQRSSEVFS